MLKRIGSTYSDDLASFIRKCLARNFHQRPTTSELCNLPFGTESLRLIGSSLVSSSETKKHSVAPPDPKWPVVKLGEYIETNVKNTAAVEQALRLMKKKSKAELAQVRRPILLAMSNCKDNESIVLMTYEFIQLAGLTADLARPLLSSMRSCATNEKVQIEACQLLAKLNSDQLSAKLGELGAIQDIVSLLRAKNEKLLTAATGALWAQCANEMNASVATAEKAFKQILTMMESYPKNHALMINCISSVWSLCLEDDNEDMAIDQATPLIFSSLKMHPSNGKSKINCSSSVLNLLRLSATSRPNGSDRTCLVW